MNTSSISVIKHVAVLTIVEMLAIYYIENAILQKNNIYLLIGLVGYTIVGYLYYLALNNSRNIIKISVMWQCLNIILITALGYFIFHKKITPKLLISILLALVAVGLQL